MKTHGVGRLGLYVAIALSVATSLGGARPASAFCGFFVSGSDQKPVSSASQVVLMRKGNRTVMTLSNTYEGPAADFAMVIPVPVVLKKDQVKTLPPSIFKHIEQLTAPRLVEYWEQDPCQPMVLGSMRGAALGVTRLHTRYSKDTLSEDLVFRAASPMVGGRADNESGDGGGPQTAKRDSSNNFQGRYIVRPYWTKKVACEQPQRNVWGGPPDGRNEAPFTARGLDDAPRGQLELASVLRTGVPALGLSGRKRRVAP